MRWREREADSSICYEEGRGREVGREVGQAVNCSSETSPPPENETQQQQPHVSRCYQWYHDF